MPPARNEQANEDGDRQNETLNNTETQKYVVATVACVSNAVGKPRSPMLVGHLPRLWCM